MRFAGPCDDCDRKAVEWAEELREELRLANERAKELEHEIEPAEVAEILAELDNYCPDRTERIEKVRQHIRQLAQKGD